tara:strand:+ start:1413 stop:1580 length:168 start_codon:yes stop_codon:yes gene_type:complete
MKEFYRTLSGKRFFDGDLPVLIRALKEIANELKNANELKRKELKINEKLMKRTDK